jgi:hypothetical protein
LELARADGSTRLFEIFDEANITEEPLKNPS